ncbi:MAG: hypothetical protein EOO88_46900 [Pedobacter sp.]|nr:MAG: hypothetical protein EOO88_46900 [Pedobacter sp.]
MRSFTEWRVRIDPDASHLKKFTNPIVVAVFLVALAAGVSSSGAWVATAMASHSNAAAMQVAENDGYE